MILPNLYEFFAHDCYRCKLLKNFYNTNFQLERRLSLLNKEFAFS